MPYPNWQTQTFDGIYRPVLSTSVMLGTMAWVNKPSIRPSADITVYRKRSRSYTICWHRSPHHEPIKYKKMGLLAGIYQLKAL